MTIKRSRSFLIIASVATFIVALLFWSKIEMDEGDGIQAGGALTQAKETPGSSSQIQGSPPPPESREVPMKDLSFQQEFEAHSAQMGQTHADPAALGRDLDIFASKLSPIQLRELAKKALDADADGDKRALAIDLLSRNHGDLAAELLADFASSSVPQLQEPRRAEYEILLRVMAVEGVMQAQAQAKAIGLLNKISATTDNRFLNDRSQRALNYLKGHGSPPSEQDQKALEKLIK